MAHAQAELEVLPGRPDPSWEPIAKEIISRTLLRRQECTRGALVQGRSATSPRENVLTRAARDLPLTLNGDRRLSKIHVYMGGRWRANAMASGNPLSREELCHMIYSAVPQAGSLGGVIKRCRLAIDGAP